jgi:hypothetical protein
MANYFYADLGTLSSPSITMAPYNQGGNNLYFRVYTTSNYSLPPGCKVKAIIVPSGITTLPDPSGVFSVSELITRLRKNKVYSDETLGIFSVTGGENNSSSTMDLTFNNVKINQSGYSWENYPFNLHWLVQRKDLSEVYGSVSGIYSLPHNIQNNELTISGQLISSNNLMKYTLFWNAINNESGYVSNGPYRCLVNYTWNSGNAFVSGFTNWVYYPAGNTVSGITFNVPFNDPRTYYGTNSSTGVPAQYDINITNVGKTGYTSLNKVIKINHQTFNNTNNYFKNLDSEVFQHPNPELFKKVDEVKILPEVIDRKRLSIGINDINIKNNTYVKKGMYISPFYSLDIDMYTFSLKVDEFIPVFSSLNPYDIVKYYVEFNSKWERISPITRGDEFEDKILVPKLIVFDKAENTNTIKYIDSGNIKGFRIKIVFDLSSLGDVKFTSPEVYDYKCMIFTKDQFLNI